jgi:hypothetical protein
MNRGLGKHLLEVAMLILIEIKMTSDCVLKFMAECRGNPIAYGPVIGYLPIRFGRRVRIFEIEIDLVRSTQARMRAFSCIQVDPDIGEFPRVFEVVWCRRAGWILPFAIQRTGRS